MKIVDLYKIERDRLRNIDSIAKSNIAREHNDTIAVQLFTFADFITASNENSEDFHETVDRMSGVLPVVTEVHLDRCINRNIANCSCFESDRPSRGFSEVTIL